MLNILVFLFLPCMNDLNDFNHTGNTTWNLLLVLTPPLKWSRKNWTLYFRVCLAQSIVELSLPLIQSLDFYYYQLTEKAMAAHSSTLAWKIPWVEEPGRLQSIGVMKSRAPLSNFTFTFHFHALEKEMAIHSSVLAWRIPGMGEPGGLPSMGSHRVGYDWSDLAAAAAVSTKIVLGFSFQQPCRELVISDRVIVNVNQIKETIFETRGISKIIVLRHWFKDYFLQPWISASWFLQ